MDHIVVIGVTPPCPRCGLLSSIITSKVELLQLDASVTHIAFTSREARKIARGYGLIPGTAKQVAEKIGVPIDSDRISIIIRKDKGASDAGYAPYNDCNWSAELDDALKLFENRSNEVGIMMTPVLVINGEIKHQGSVPALEDIDGWLSELG